MLNDPVLNRVYNLSALKNVLIICPTKKMNKGIKRALVSSAPFQ